VALMGSLYYTDMADLFRGAGLVVVEDGPCAGWQSRARSSGGFSSPPLGCQWHHTASKTSPESDVSWQTNGSDDAPIGNCTIMRDGSIWMVAAGAANTAGKGGPITFSRGTVPLDSGNSTTWAFEVANNGVGEAWPQVQIDAYFTASNVANKRFGNRPTDLMTHNGYCEPSCPGRKIDPATAAAVQGPWKPRSINSAGTWNQSDVRDEANRRATTEPPPPEDEVTDADIEAIAQRAAALVWAHATGKQLVSQSTAIVGHVDNIPGDVWRFKANDIAKDNQPEEVVDLLRFTRSDASKAFNRSDTAPKRTWDHMLTDVAKDNAPIEAGDLLRFTRGDANKTYNIVKES
jgi:hypothetical protein